MQRQSIDVLVSTDLRRCKIQRGLDWLFYKIIKCICIHYIRLCHPFFSSTEILIMSGLDT